MELQMIEVLARPTNDPEKFCGQRNGGKFQCTLLTKFRFGFHKIFGYHTAAHYGMNKTLYSSEDFLPSDSKHHEPGETYK